MMRADFGELGQGLRLEPSEEAAHGDTISGACVRVANMRSEEIDEPERCALAGAGDHRRHGQSGCWLDDGE